MYSKFQSYSCWSPFLVVGRSGYDHASPTKLTNEAYRKNEENKQGYVSR